MHSGSPAGSSVYSQSSAVPWCGKWLWTWKLARSLCSLQCFRTDFQPLWNTLQLHHWKHSGTLLYILIVHKIQWSLFWHMSAFRMLVWEFQIDPVSIPCNLAHIPLATYLFDSEAILEFSKLCVPSRSWPWSYGGTERSHSANIH